LFLILLYSTYNESIIFDLGSRNIYTTSFLREINIAKKWKKKKAHEVYKIARKEFREFEYPKFAEFCTLFL
jgi:hypothetical protein